MNINNNLSSAKTIGLTVSIVIFVISVQLESVQPVVAQVTCGRGTMLERYTHSSVPVPNGFEPCPSRTVYDSHNNSCYSYGVLCHGTKLLGVATPFYDPTTGNCVSATPLGDISKGNTTSSQTTHYPCARGTMIELYTHTCVPVPNGFKPCPSRTVYASRDPRVRECIPYDVICQSIPNSVYVPASGACRPCSLTPSTPVYDPTTGNCVSATPNLKATSSQSSSGGNTTSGGGGGKFVQPAQSGGQNQTK